MNRGRPRSAEARAAILAAARTIFERVGYSRVTFDSIAAEAGASKATIYRWWSSKGELLLEAAEDDIAIGLVPDTGNTRADLRIAIEQLVSTFSKPLAKAVIFAAIAPFEAEPGLAQRFRENYVYPWRISATEALQRGVERGDITTDADTALMLDVVVGTVLQRTIVVEASDTTAIAEKLLTMVLGPRPRPRSPTRRPSRRPSSVPKVRST